MSRGGLIASLVLFASLFAWWLLRESSPRSPEPVEMTRQAPGTLRLAQAQWGSLKIEPIRKKSFDLVATSDGVIAVNDNLTVPVFSQFSGRVTEVYAQAGQAVRKGALLASVKAVEAAQTKSDLATAVAGEATARKQMEAVRVIENRQHELFLAEAGAEKDWLQSKVDLAAAENARAAAQMALVAAREKAAILGDRGVDGTHIGNGEIIAPIDGLIAQRQVARGQFVNSLALGGNAPVFTITDPRTVWVLANVRETDSAQLKLGQPIEISALALPERILRGRVSWISASVDPSSHRIAVRAEIANPDAVLKPQMTVTVRLLDDHPVETLAIPRSALVYDGPDVHCYVVTAERTLTLRSLKLGRIDGELAEVKSGLSAGDLVVSRGALFIDRAADDNAP